MKIEEAVFYQLSNHPEVTALVDTRIYPRVVPQDCALPNIAFWKVSRVAKRAHNDQPGQSNLVYSRFQFTCSADSSDEADALGRAVQGAFDNFHGRMGGSGGLFVYSSFAENVVDGYEFTSNSSQMLVDVMIGYQEV